MGQGKNDDGGIVKIFAEDLSNIFMLYIHSICVCVFFVPYLHCKLNPFYLGTGPLSQGKSDEGGIVKIFAGDLSKVQLGLLLCQMSDLEE